MNSVKHVTFCSNWEAMITTGHCSLLQRRVWSDEKNKDGISDRNVIDDGVYRGSSQRRDHSGQHDFIAEIVDDQYAGGGSGCDYWW